jgi:hypothetical protein
MTTPAQKPESNDKQGRRLVSELGRSQGNTVRGGPTDRSFDLTVIDQGSEIRAEVKGMAPDETWVGINGLGALKRLVDDAAYRLYFCVLSEKPRVLRLKSPFLYLLLNWTPKHVADLRTFVELIERHQPPGLGFSCRLQFHLPYSVAKVVSFALAKRDGLAQAIDGTWEYDGSAWTAL